MSNTLAALDAGADDYVTKPVGIDELLARIRAAVRCVPAPDAADVLETAHVRIDLGDRRLWHDGTEIRVTPTEWGVARAATYAST